MPKVTVGDWVEAMRDGSHKFGVRALRNGRDPKTGELAGGSYCALGVLCDIVGYNTADKRHGTAFRAPNGERLEGTNVGDVLNKRLSDLNISRFDIANANDRSDNYDNVIEYITCDVGLSPDTVIYDSEES